MGAGRLFVVEVLAVPEEVLHRVVAGHTKHRCPAVTIGHDSQQLVKVQPGLLDHLAGLGVPQLFAKHLGLVVQQLVQ